MTENIYSLTQLQTMSEEDFVRAFPQKIAKWIQQGYTVDAKQLVKAIILATKELHLPLSDERGCREVWYNPVKPILYKAIGKRLDDPTHNYMRMFELILSGMVKAGELTYADLGVSDFRTLREIYEAVENANCWKNIILFVEKDSAYVHLKPLQNLFNINIMSGSGWSNTAGIERMLRNLAEKGIHEVVVFTLTDYDPFGFAISKEFADKCSTLGLYVVEQHRIGINVEHATPEILEIQKYPVKRGRRLSVNGVCFDSDKWLAEYGIGRTYGLEIEAVSAQPGGHQALREIVAKELLQYLKETDRVDEITKRAWENLPFRVIQDMMYLVDNQFTERELIDVKPEERPGQYLWYEQFKEQFNTLWEEMEEKSSEVSDDIASLEEEIAELQEQKDQIEGPYRNSLGVLKRDYRLSRNILIWCLYQHYLKHKEKWLRENYHLGYPPGCLVKAVEQKQDLGTFIKQVDTTTPSKDMSNFLIEAYNNGEIKKLIEGFFNGGASHE